jgi:hypothetical protein
MKNMKIEDKGVTDTVSGILALCQQLMVVASMGVHFRALLERFLEGFERASLLVVASQHLCHTS